MKKLLFISLLLMLLSFGGYSAGPPCPPFSPCWCVQNPTHPRCTQTGVPINGGIEWLAI